MAGPTNLISMQTFDAVQDVPVTLQIAEVLFLMPILRWSSDCFIEAAGDYDLCMDVAGTTYTFVSRRPGTTTFAYRFVSTYFLASVSRR